MAGGQFSLAKLFGITLRESANDGSDFTNPDADYRRLFLGEDGLLHLRDSAGAITDVGGDAASHIADASDAHDASAISIADAGSLITATEVEAALQEIAAKSGAIATFTPTWTAASVNPVIGNGTITGHYQLIATKLYWVCIAVTIGSTTTAGTGNYTIGNLPFTTKATPPTRQIIHAYYRDTGTDNFVGLARFGASATATETIFFGDTAAAKSWTPTVPVAPANGDEIIFEGILAST